MELNAEEKEILKRLFVSEEDVLKRLKSLVDLSQGLFSIVEETGEMFIEDPAILNNSDKIFLYLLGSYFASRYGIKSKGHSMSPSELANRLNVPITTIPAPMQKLIQDKLALKTEKGAYQINFDNYKKIKDFLEELRKKHDKNAGRIK